MLKPIFEKTTQFEKDTFSEVSTPPELISKMLSFLPIDFFKHNHTVLEPCCGKGSIVIALYNAFFDGLKDVIPDPEQRHITIVEQLLFFGDINFNNVEITKKLLFSNYSSGNPNFFVGDTLSISMHKSAFDAVIVNPPFSKKFQKKKGNWQCFLQKSLSFSNIIVFVSPPSWRKPMGKNKGRSSGLFELLTSQYHMQYLQMYGIDDGVQFFNCKTRFDIFCVNSRINLNLKCLNNINININTKVFDIDGVEQILDLRLRNWLPNGNIAFFDKLRATKHDVKCPVLFSASKYKADKSWISPLRTNFFSYPCIHSTPKKGIRFMFSSRNNGFYNIPKVIFGEGGPNWVILDMEGAFAMTQGAIAIEVITHAEATHLAEILVSNQFKKMMNYCSFSSYRINWLVFADFKKSWYNFLKLL